GVRRPAGAGVVAMSGVVAFAVALGLARLFGMANREDTRPGFFCLLQWLLLGGVGVAALAAMLDGSVVGALALGGAVVLAFPWAIARRIAIPAGWWRIARALVRSSAWVWYDDNRGGALVAAAWASARAGGPPAALSFIERECEAHATGGGALILASGLATAARGDLDGARRLIASVVEFEGPSGPSMARRLAVEWCAAEAATRGDWRRVLQLGTGTVGTAASRWLAQVAARLEGASPMPSDAELRRGWRRLPRRRASRALLERALACPALARERPVESDAARPRPRLPDGDPHDVALRMHADLLARERGVRVEQLEAVGRAWDRVLDDPRFAAQARARALALGSKGDPIDRLRERVDGELLDLVRASAVKVGDDDEPTTGATFERVRRSLHTKLLDELEITADALATRVKARRAHAIHEEWREWLTLRGQYERAVAQTGLGLRRHAFAAIHGPACSFAAWLWNERRAKVHAHQMFRWLLREAEIVEDEAAILLQRRNVDCKY
ncbi:MAG TPA: hypothetical protein VFG69_06380, partial [Nannocystaceae bacterium]|nr:hypothetical protein [Nannocystaceae bacterium]